MREERAYPYSPARTLARAYLAGLAALKDLLRERVVNKIRYVYESTRDQWNKALAKWERSKKRGKRDFWYVTEVERHLRRNFNKMIWETTARYGNVEWKRVQNERKGRIGPMNRLLNMAGAQLRNYAMTRFPFPEPEIRGKRGNKTNAGYEGDAAYPWVNVAHVTLPELDFIDMIRAHVFELCRKCFIYGVPVRDARKYVNLLIWRLSPFLEYLYTSGESGRWGFKCSKKRKKEDQEKCADEILREIVEELRVLYATRHGRVLPPTHAMADDIKSWDVSFFLDEVGRLRFQTDGLTEDETEKQEQTADMLMDLCRRGILRDIDAQRLGEEYAKRARWYGIKWHELMTNGLVQPYSLRDVVLKGDDLVDDGDGYSIMAEVPVKTELGDGRADTVVFRRELIQDPLSPEDRPVWRPLGVFDIKSKTAFNWDIKGEEKESRKHGDIVVPKFRMKRRGLTDEEWEAALAKTPDRYGSRQLDAYSRGLRDEFEELTGEMDCVPPITGTVVMDTTQDAGLMRKSLHNLLISIFNAGSSLPQEDALIVPDNEGFSKLKYGVVLDGITKGQNEMLSGTGDSPESEREETALIVSKREDKRFILCLSAPSASRSGPTAAWIAQYWHGLELIREVSQEKRGARVVWLDLVGDFATRRLAWTRLRLSQHIDEMKEFFDEIEWIDLSESVRGHLFRREGSLIDSIPSLGETTIVVVSGWDFLRSCIPPRLSSVLYDMEMRLLDWLGEKTNYVVWFSEPRTEERTSSAYQRRKLSPFSDSSPLSRHVTEIVWNLPVRPYAFGQKTPLIDELRVIVRETVGSSESTLAEVPALKDWASRFWTQRDEDLGAGRPAKRGRQVLTPRDIIGNESLEQDILDCALDLLPSKDCQENQETIPLSVKKKPQSRYPYNRLTYRSSPVKTGSGRGYAHIQKPIAPLTHPRGYRASSVNLKPIETTRRPPNEASLKMAGMSESDVWDTEVRRLRSALDCVSSVEPSSEMVSRYDWEDFVSVLSDLITDTRPTEEIVADVTSLFRTHLVSSELWESMLWIRDRVPFSGLRKDSKVMLEGLVKKQPNLLHHTGNYLFLLLLSLIHSNSDLSSQHYWTLWEWVRSWWLMQLGLVSDDELNDSACVSVYETSAIWHGLEMRAEKLPDLVSGYEADACFGQIIVTLGPEIVDDYWLVIQDPLKPEHMLCGVWRGLSPFVPDNRMRWGLVGYNEIANSALSCREPIEVHDVIIRSDDDSLLMWLKEEYDWIPLGHLEIVRRNGAFNGIRGMKLSAIENLVESEKPAVVGIPEGLRERVSAILGSISKTVSSCIPVKCRLSIDMTDFVLELLDVENENELIEEVRFRKTSRLVDFLRIPLTGCRMFPEMSVYRQFYSWNPYEDIEYGELGFLRPYIERKRPFKRFYIRLPETARELSSLETITVRLTVTHDESVCPIVSGEANSHGDCWRLGCDEVFHASSMNLINRVLGDSEVAAMMNSGEITINNARWHLSFEFSPEAYTRDGIVFRESRPFARHLGLKWVVPGTHLFMEQEQLCCLISKEETLIRLAARSNLSNDLVYSGELVRFSKEMDIEEALGHVESVLKNIVTEYFDISGTRYLIQQYDSLISTVKGCLEMMC